MSKELVDVHRRLAVEDDGFKVSIHLMHHLWATHANFCQSNMQLRFCLQRANENNLVNGVHALRQRDESCCGVRLKEAARPQIVNHIGVHQGFQQKRKLIAQPIIPLHLRHAD